MSVMAVNFSEQRRLNRIHIVYYLRVFDADGRLLGHVGDVSPDGMRVIGEHALDAGRTLDLHMEFPLSGHRREWVALRAECRWSRRDVNPDFYNSGFRLIDPSAAAVARIRELIDEFSFGSL